MKKLRELVWRATAALMRRRADAEMDEELGHHFEALTEEYERQGLPRKDARQAALRDFGGVAQIRESYRDQRSLPFLETLKQDAIYASRMWRRTPAFSLIVIVILAIGIGATSATFTFVNALLFRQMSGHAAELVGLYSHDRTRADSYRSFSYPNYQDIRDRSDVFDSLLAHTFAMVGIPSGDITRRAFVEVVSANYFSTVGVQLAAGRAFSAEEERPGANLAVAIVTYGKWKESGFAASFIGSKVRINAQDFTIIGVAPPGFTSTTALLSPEMWVPLGMFDTVVNDFFKNNGEGVASRSNQGLSVAGRLKPGIRIEAANDRLDALSKQLEEAYPADNAKQVLTVKPLCRVSISTSPCSDTGPAVLAAIIMPLSGAVLLIACLNIANMFMARGTARRKEIAIRVAIGGGRKRIVRQLVTESLLLAFAGAAGGVAVGYVATRAAVSSLSGMVFFPVHLETRPDMNILLVAVAFAFLSTLVFGLAPALKISRTDVVTDLKDAGANAYSGGRAGARMWLVTGQIAVSLMLMVAGGLFGRAAMQAGATNPGYRYDDLLLMSVDPSLAGLDENRGRAATQAVLERLRVLPGVQSVAMNSQVPFGEFHERPLVERPGQPRLETPQSATFTIISSDYFKTLGLKVLRGREFTRTEELSHIRSAIIDEPLARSLFPNEDPLGQTIRLTDRSDALAPRPRQYPIMEIVGIVPGIRDELTDDAPQPHLYASWGSDYRATMHLYVRTYTNSDGQEMLSTIRRQAKDIDSKMPILELASMQNFHDRGLLLWALRAAGRTLIVFGVVALVLAAVGVYGVKSYLVSLRTREIGIRIALGARSNDILWLIFSDGARMTFLGLAVGFPLAIGLAVLLRSAIFGVSAFDPVVMVAAPAILLAAAALASYIPARRALRVAPLDALRTD